MTDPFHDWRNPAKPCMWSKGYHDNDHVVKIGDTIEHWDNGELTTKEMVVQLMNLYCQGYSLGLEDAHYQVPATIEPAIITRECIAVFHVSNHSCDCSIAAIWYKN